MQPLLSLSLFLVFVSAYVCPHGHDNECSSVTRDIDYVECVNHACKCRTSQGFVGSATPSSKCSCPDGYSIYRQHNNDDGNNNDGLPYCARLSDAVAFTHEQDRNEILYDIVHDLYTSLVYPGPAIVMQQLITGQTFGGIWDHVADNAVGRVDPAGDFSDKDGIVEYFYGAVWTPQSHILNVTVQKLIVQGNVAYIDVDMFFQNYNLQGQPVLAYNLTQTGSFTFNKHNKIKSIDLIIHNLGMTANAINANHTQAALDLCSVVLFVANCTAAMDPDGFYSDYPSCVAFMNTIGFGTWDNLRTNSIACRQYHAILAIARPQVHCSHAGRTGGGACIDTPYEDLYLKQY